jgi:PmbA protein
VRADRRFSGRDMQRDDWYTSKRSAAELADPKRSAGMPRIARSRASGHAGSIRANAA